MVVVGVVDEGQAGSAEDFQAVHSLFQFAALDHPEHAASISRVLAISPKRCEHALITYLTDDEIDALLAAPDLDTWTGRRDHALL